MSDDLFLVYDSDGSSRLIPADDYDALARAAKVTAPCPNNEDDEAAGYHGHLHTDWETFEREWPDEAAKFVRY